jgi:sugar phosphate permease
VHAPLYALAGFMFAAAVAAAIWLRDGPRIASAALPAPDAVRDPRIWRLSAASALMIIGQIGVTSLLVLYLYRERNWSAADAALALGAVQVGAAVARVLAGRWSDLRDERIEPFRRLAAVAGVLLLAAALGGPTAVPLLMAGGVAAMSWNGLSFTAAAEISGRRQAGTAMGIQNTAMRVVGAAVPVGLGALASAVSWHAVFVVMGVTPLIARAILGPLVHDELRRRSEREARLESRAHAGGPAPMDAVGS